MFGDDVQDLKIPFIMDISIMQTFANYPGTFALTFTFTFAFACTLTIIMTMTITITITL